jgi:hypothetical protein
MIACRPGTEQDHVLKPVNSSTPLLALGASQVDLQIDDSGWRVIVRWRRPRRTAAK